MHLELGIDLRITASGIPVDPMFAEKQDKQEIHDKHGLARDLMTILVDRSSALGLWRICRFIAGSQTPCRSSR